VNYKLYTILVVLEITIYMYIYYIHVAIYLELHNKVL